MRLGIALIGASLVAAQDAPAAMADQAATGGREGGARTGAPTAALERTPLRTGAVAVVPGWTATNPPNAFLDNCNLLTDGRVMCHVSETNRWRVLSPDPFGSYANGSWAFTADMPPGNDATFGCVNCTYAPKYFDNAVLADGRVVVIGGEYNGNSSTNIWTNIGFMYDPVMNMWSSQLSEVFGGNNFGDAASVVLADGRMVAGPVRGGVGATRNMEAFNPATLAFTALNPTGKGASNSEETWNILPDGRVFTVNANRASMFEIYDPVLNDWGSDGPTPVLLADFGTNPDSREVGPAVLRADGQLVYFSGTNTGLNALYDVNAGTWSHPIGVDFPLVPAQTYHYAVADGPASLLPNGDVLVQASPVTNVKCGNMVPPPPPTCGVFNTPSHFFQVDYDTNVLTQVADTPNAAAFNAYEGRMILLPTGEVLLTAFDQNNTGDVMLYSNGETFKEAWRPVITVGPGPITAGNTYAIKGLLFNGFSEGATYGDDAQASTNYPLVRITNQITGHVFYARTHDHSRMGVQSVGSLEVVTTQFDAPAVIEPGPNALEVVVNGIPSLPLILGAVDLSIEKTAVPHPIVNAGEELVYTIKVTNNSEAPAAGVFVRDRLPGEVVYVDNTNPFGCDTTNLPELECGIGNIEPGGMRTFEIKTRVPVDAVVGESDGTIVLTNTATVEPVDLDTDPRDNTAILKTFVEDSADLKVIKLSKPDTAVSAGQLFTYTVYVDNLGPSSARGVFFTDDMIASGAFTLLSTITDPARNDLCAQAPASPPQSGVVTRCALNEPLEPLGADANLDGIPDSGRWRVQFVARANQTQDIDNVVHVDTGPGTWTAQGVVWNGGTPDPVPANNTAIDAISIIDTADVSVVKTAEAEEQVLNQPGLIFNNALLGQGFPTGPNYSVTQRVTAGRRVHYSLTVTNQGPSTANNVVVTDRLPGGMRFYQGSLIVERSVPNGLVTILPTPCDTGTPGQPLDKMVCGLGTLAVGQTIFINFQMISDASLPAGTVLENDASVASDEHDPQNRNNYGFTQTTVLTAADMAVAKSAVGEVVTAYDTTLRRFVETDTANQVTAGKTLRYQLQVQNNGPSDGRNVTVQENLPAAPVPGPVTFVRATGADCRPDDVNQQVLFCQLGDMAAGARKTIDIYVAVDAAVPATTPLTNSATVLNSGSSTIPPGPPPAIPGVDPTRPITWDPCVACAAGVSPNVATNLSTVGAVADVFVRFSPVERLVPRSGAGAGSAGASTSSAASAGPAAAQRSLSLVGRLSGALADMLRGVAATPRAAPATVAPQDRAVTRQQGTAPIEAAVAGTERRYRVSFGNDGPSVARNVGLTHQLDFKQPGILGETFVRCEPVDPDDLVTCAFTGPNTVTVTSFRHTNDLVIPAAGTGTLNPGDLFQYVLVTRIDPGYVLDGVDLVALNQATVTTTTTDFRTQDNTDRELTLISAAADLRLTKVDDAAGFMLCDPVAPLGTLTYDLTVTNDGPSDAAEVFVVDHLPVAFVVADPAEVDVTVSRGQVVEVRDDGRITVRIGNDPNNNGVNELGRVNALSAPVTIQIQVRVRADAACGGQAENRATVETRRNDVRWPPAPDFQPGLGGGPRTPTNDPASANSADVEATTVECPSVRVVKTVSFDGTCPGVHIDAGVFNRTGQPVTFCFEVSNTGTTFLDGVLLSDVLDTRSLEPTVIFTDTVTSGADPLLPIRPGESVRRQVTIPQLLAEWECGEVTDTVTVTANPVNSGRTDQPCLEDVTDTDTAVIDVPCAGVDWRLQLPILGGTTCPTLVQVQNLGKRDTKVILVAWGDESFCPPQAAGPLKVECGGLLRPGSAWTFTASQIPSAARSAVLYAVNATDIVTNIDGNESRFDLEVCDALMTHIVGDWKQWSVFDLAYRYQRTYRSPFDGSGLHQIVLDFQKHQGEPIAATVNRSCPDAADPNVMSSAAYTGISSDQEGARDPVSGARMFYAPLVFANKGGLSSKLCIQNSGDECTSLELWFKGQDECLRNTLADVLTLSPGETVCFDPATVVGPDWLGSAYIRSTQPLGIVVDTMGPNHFTAYNGVAADVFALGFSAGNQIAYLPLTYSEYQGWDTAIQVQNLEATLAAKVKVYFLDRSGDIITTLVDWICPRGSQTFFLPVIANLPGQWAGSARVESAEWITPGGPNVLAPRVVAVALMERWSDPARTSRREAIAYNGQGECLLYDWQLGSGAGGTASGAAVLAMPLVAKGNRGIDSELAITNLVPKPGFTDFVLFFYDQNGLIEQVCQKVSEKEVDYIDLSKYGFLDRGYLGSAVISAVFWEHDVFDSRGQFVRNVVGLGAVAIERIGTAGAAGADLPGDESKGYEAFPVFATYRPNDPVRCPGVPGGFGGR